jgi:hypothetical protein
MARAEIEDENDLRQAIADNKAAIARIHELIISLEEKLTSIHACHQEVAQSSQDSKRDRKHPLQCGTDGDARSQRA